MIFVIVDYADMLTKNLKLSVPVAQYCNIAIGGHGHWDAQCTWLVGYRSSSETNDVDIYCEESGLGPIHVCVGTTVPKNTSSSGVWLGPLVGCGFGPRRGLIHSVQTIVLTLCRSDSHVVIQQ